jgi:hypothetical protein
MISVSAACTFCAVNELPMAMTSKAITAIDTKLPNAHSTFFKLFIILPFPKLTVTKEREKLH